MLLAASLFVPAPRSDAEWGGVGGFAAGNPQPPPIPATGDTDGDGIPNTWESANLLNPANAADAASDFDRDGLTALQEYGLHLATAGVSGKHLGSWAASWIPRPTGFIGTPRVTIVEQAPNGIILAQVSGRLSDATVSTTFPYTWSPASGTWTRVLPPPGVTVSSLTSLDVNSSGQVVGYYSSGGARGFVWTPGASGGQSTVFQLHTTSGTLHAVPKRISDSGHVVGNVGSLSGPGFAGTSDGDEITFSGLLSNPVFHDVNDYGEFIGSASNPLTWGMETFLALPGQPVFSTGIGGAAFEEMAGVWGDLPEIDPGEIVWDEGPSGYSYFREGTAIDTRTGNPVAVHEGYGAAFYWYYDSGGYYDTGWYSYPGFSHVFAGVNDWGEFTGHYNASLYRTDFTDYDQSGYSGFYNGGSDNGIFFYEGDYHVSKARPSIYGVSNDPRVLIGTPYALWSGSLVVPVTNLLPAGYPTSFAYARLADNGRVILQQSTTSQILLLKPNQDSDGDGMPNDWEVFYGLNPADAQDAAADANQNGTSNRAEFALRANPLAAAGAGAGVQFIDLRPGIDTDGDGMPNTWEWKHGLNHSNASDAGSDDDGDGLTNLKEFLLRTGPRNPDTDGDGVPDGQEIKNGTDPHSASDLDADGMADHWELDFSRRLLAHRDILSASQIAILETGNFDPVSDILGEGVTNLERYREEVQEPVLPGSEEMSFQGKTRSIWVGYISDQPPSYYAPGGDSYIWMTSYVNGTDLGAVISHGGILASDPQYTVGLLDSYFPWKNLTWWQSGTSDSISRGGWPLDSSKHSTTEQAGGYGDLPEITVNSCSFVYNESQVRLKASDISASDRALSFIEVTTSASLAPNVTFTWLDPHIAATKVHTFVIPAGKTRSETVQVSTPLAEGLSGKTALRRAAIKEVSFAGSGIGGDNYHELKSDDLSTTYSAPHWVDNDGDGKPAESGTVFGPYDEAERNFPVAFTRNSRAKIGAKFSVQGVPSGTTVRIRGASADGINLPELEVTSAPDGTLFYPATVSSSGSPDPSVSSFPDSIQFYNATDATALKIKWDIQLPNSSWMSLGSTKHTVFLTLGKPLAMLKDGPAAYRITLFWLACANTIGDTGSDIINMIKTIYKGPGSFERLHVKRFSHVTGTTILPSFTYHGKSSPGNHILAWRSAVCGGWAQFLVDVMAVHGVKSSTLTIRPINYLSSNIYSQGKIPSEFVLKPVPVPAAGGDAPAASTNGEPSLFLGRSVPAQGGIHNKMSWSRHVLFKYSDNSKFVLYDPSYGTGPFEGPFLDFALFAYNNSLAGFYSPGDPGRVWPPDRAATDIMEVVVPSP